MPRCFSGPALSNASAAPAFIPKDGLPQSIRYRLRLDAYAASNRAPAAVCPPHPLDEYRSYCVVYTSTARNSRGQIALDGGCTLGSELQVGDTAPEFSATATRRNPLVLSDLLEDKAVVLAFFPKAFTGG